MKKHSITAAAVIVLSFGMSDWAVGGIQVQPEGDETVSSESAHKFTNRLINETSPYLLQHAHNPVDWWPWGPEAFAEARRRNVPIFLSIGYSTCYWCHVMERESFENETTAKLMNENFVCIKVDREERPDVDDIYMAATQILTGRGGWPMSVFLEPEKLRPFWCGTYFPDEPRQGMPSFSQVLEGMAQAWTTQKEDVLKQAEQIAEAVRTSQAQTEDHAGILADHVTTAVQSLIKGYDPRNGGFGGAPKFPQPAYLRLLLNARQVAGDETTQDAIDQVIKGTLDKMAIGGVYDQVGGGFHRYSTDATWTVPHFEKMLYDNAQLATTYALAARAYEDPFYARIARRTIDYVLREMRDPGGAFYSAQDAEVDSREGLNYLWTKQQVENVLEKDDAAFINNVYNLDLGTNFRDPHHADEPASNVLRMSDRPDQLAAAMDMDESAFLDRLDALNSRLYEARSKRKQPRLDDKVLIAWNGLMIDALARAGVLLDESSYIAAAHQAVDFIQSNMVSSSGELFRVYRAGNAKTSAYLEDYAMLIQGLVSLARADGDTKALDWARQLTARAEAIFTDGTTPGYFDSRADQEDLFMRTRSAYDGAIPCGQSVLANASVDLHELTDDDQYLAQAGDCLQGLSHSINTNPIGVTTGLRAFARLVPLAPDLAIQLAGDAEAEANDGGPGQIDDEGQVPVVVFADLDRVVVSTQTPGIVTLSLQIADGFHIVAAEPGDGFDSLIPMRVMLISGQGISVYADYPAGTPNEAQEGLKVYTGEIQFQVVIEKTGPIQGRPIIGLRYQVCTDRECLKPATVELDVAIDVDE